MKWLPWTLRRGRALARKLEDALMPLGWHVAMGGSVLHAGKSDKDLDLVIYPRTKVREHPTLRELDELRTALEACGLHMLVNAHRVRARFREGGSSDDKHVEVWTIGGCRRVDLFLLR